MHGGLPRAAQRKRTLAPHPRRAPAAAASLPRATLPFVVVGSALHRAFTRAEEALLARTLVGRRLASDVRGPDGLVAFAAGAEIDRELLDRARERELLDEVARAAEPGTSDTELEDLFSWLAERRRRGGA